MTLSSIASELYNQRPSSVLYHYTSLGGLSGIVSSQSIWATEIRYFNDAAELRHTSDILSAEIGQRLAESGKNHTVLKQFREWLRERLTFGHMLFVVSFTANGNLLSQWRSYCSPGKGISAGFKPEHLCQCASEQAYSVVKCIYDNDRKKGLATRIVNAVETLAQERGENLDPSKRHPSQSFHGVFEEIESDLLRVAAVLKHSSFREEEEWRVVSPLVTKYVGASIRFREGKTALVPYKDFSLQRKVDGVFQLEHAYLGPTPDINLSMHSLTMHLSDSGVSPKSGLTYCQIPYRG